MIPAKSFANHEKLVFYPKFFRRFFGLLAAASILIGCGTISHSSWRHSKKLQPLITGHVLAHEGTL
ncbi:MAG TPA: hypothetical protein H9770_00965 [Candidatus Fournierella excrementigallinarum]|nr:hypothetical protein [Candidatus Fournierella excrementigallinarum]